MAHPDDTPGQGCPVPHRGLSRRSFLTAAGGVAVGGAAVASGMSILLPSRTTAGSSTETGAEPFYGGHQGGVATTPQSHTYFAAFTLTTTQRSDIVALMKTWTAAAARLAGGETAQPLTTNTGGIQPDSGDAMGLGAASLTINFGFGPTLFSINGKDRFGLASQRPAALVELPRFPGDQLIASKVGGDITVHACADDPQVAFHAVRQLARLSTGVAAIAWTQAGFNEVPASSGTPRNLMGFKDGTINPTGAQMTDFVWVGSEGPAWMHGGTYLVARRIRIFLERWDGEALSSQEQIVGRHKVSGAPLGEASEFSPLDLAAKDSSGNFVIPLDSHVRLSAPAENGGQMILRRGYAYNDGVDDDVERWPPWQQALMYDAGLLFCAYQRDPRKGFIPIYQVLSENDALSQFTTHTGSVVVALPPAAVRPGDWVGRELLE